MDARQQAGPPREDSQNYRPLFFLFFFSGSFLLGGGASFLVGGPGG